MYVQGVRKSQHQDERWLDHSGEQRLDVSGLRHVAGMWQTGTSCSYLHEAHATRSVALPENSGPTFRTAGNEMCRAFGGSGIVPEHINQGRNGQLRSLIPHAKPSQIQLCPPSDSLVFLVFPPFSTLMFRPRRSTNLSSLISILSPVLLSTFEHVSCISRVEPKGLDPDHLHVRCPMAACVLILGACYCLPPWPHGCLSSSCAILAFLLENTCGRDDPSDPHLLAHSCSNLGNLLAQQDNTGGWLRKLRHTEPTNSETKPEGCAVPRTRRGMTGF